MTGNILFPVTSVRVLGPLSIARRYFTLEGARAVAVELANATFAARRTGIWGEGTTTVASDSTHFRAYDQNLFTDPHRSGRPRRS